MNVVIWSKTDCPYCVMAKQVFDKFNIKYQENVVGEGYSREQFFESNPGAGTVPQIYINGDRIGGYEDLIKYIEDTGFNGTGYN